LGGFYVGMSLNLKVSAELEITLWIGDTKISGKAMVVSSHPVFGNGIKFTHLSDEKQEYSWSSDLETLAHAGIRRSTSRASA
jgi:hypothetical protein